MWTTFHVLIYHLYIFFGEMSVCVFCPCSNWLVYLTMKFWELFIYIGCWFCVSIFTFMDYAFNFKPKNSLHSHRSQRFSPVFFSFLHFIKVYLIYKTLHIVILHILMSLNICIPLWYHHHNQGSKHIYHIQKISCVPLLCVGMCGKKN